jgi:multidrug transporter EmrE-like cation transporter
LLIPTFWGIIFDNDPTSVWLYIGLVLLAASLVFINLKDKPKENGGQGGDGDVKITLKWAIFAIIALVTNGACSTIQPAQSRIFEGKYDSIFMIIALAAVFVALSILVLVKERKEILPSLKSGAPLMVVCGLANGLVNLFVMLASPIVPNSVFFPLISAGGIVLTWIISVTLYKEKLSMRQNIGLVLGIISIVFLNL